ncbi:MAG: hypothetical protein FD136_1313 [Chitinophagaceae bacterium]|nr:MAG: hypothetical protein FD136_1313 [Chitinophagaceae bacterium]
MYKLLRAGGISQDLSAYKTLKFKATGNSTITITLVKQSVVNWADQYTLQIPVSGDNKDYAISLTDFKSTASNLPIDVSDINSIVFTMGAAAPGKSTAVQLALSNVSFSKEDLVYIRSLQVRDVSLYPNPSNGVFNVRFKADKDYSLTLNIIDAATGNVVMTKMVNATRGENSVPVELRNNSGQRMYIISLNGSNVNYKSTKIVIGKN